MDLKGKTYLVTGGAIRMGRGLCEALAGEGAHVVVHYLSSAVEAEALCALLRAQGVQSWSIQADLTSGEECEGLIDRALERSGSLEGIINNAALFERDRVRNVEWPAVGRQFALNLFAPMTLISSFARTVGKGQVINLLDKRITGMDAEHLSYVLSKKALATLTEMAAVELAPGIAVNAIAPGAVLAPQGVVSSRLPEWAGPVPLECTCEVSDVCDAMLYLLKSDVITGQTIFVDGGQHLLDDKEYGSHSNG